jgi:hypothetical protein
VSESMRAARAHGRDSVTLQQLPNSPGRCVQVAMQCLLALVKAWPESRRLVGNKLIERRGAVKVSLSPLYPCPRHCLLKHHNAERASLSGQSKIK